MTYSALFQRIYSCSQKNSGKKWDYTYLPSQIFFTLFAWVVMSVNGLLRWQFLQYGCSQSSLQDDPHSDPSLLFCSSHSSAPKFTADSVNLQFHFILVFLSVFPLLLYFLFFHLAQSSPAACVEECLSFPLSSPSPGGSKGGGPTQGVWRAHRHSPMGGELADAQTTQLYQGGRSVPLICFCTPAIGFPRSHEPSVSLTIYCPM